MITIVDKKQLIKNIRQYIADDNGTGISISISNAYGCSNILSCKAEKFIEIINELDLQDSKETTRSRVGHYPSICFFCGDKVEDTSDIIGKIPVCTYCLSEMDWKGKQATERIDKNTVKRDPALKARHER